MKLLALLSLEVLGLVSAARINIHYLSKDAVDGSSFVYQPIGEYGSSNPHHERPLSTFEQSTYPAVNLSYASHVPTVVDEEAGYIFYKNIRYAKEPIGDLRFNTPQAPDAVDGDLPVEDGSGGHSCYQYLPDWTIQALTSQAALEKPPRKFDVEEFLDTSRDAEDCLFLDVAVPIGIEDDERVPVLVWFYGGGYVFGSKDMGGMGPAGFYRRAEGEKFVFVAINYRLGAFGWLAGPKFIDQGGVSNIGLYDQRLALQWIQENIEKFGGASDQVTVMGESAGAGSITHQLVFTEEDQEGPAVLFDAAILQSPAWVPVTGSQSGLDQQDATYDKFLELLEVEDLAAAREADPEQVKASNRQLIFEAVYGTFGAGPVVDNTRIKANPLTLFRAGKQDKSVQIFVGDVAAEGLPFVPVKYLGQKDFTEDDLFDYMHEALPLLEDQTIEDVLRYYPWKPFKYDYALLSQQTQRLADIAGQALVQCNTRIISLASDNSTYNYYFDHAKYNALNIPVAHGGDVPYTFFDKEDTKINGKIAKEWQKYLLGFALAGDPNLLNPKVKMEPYGSGSKVTEFGWLYGAKGVKDPFATELCDKFWPAVWENYGGHEEEDGDDHGELK